MRLMVLDHQPPDFGGMRGVPAAVDSDGWYWQKVDGKWEKVADVYRQRRL